LCIRRVEQSIICLVPSKIERTLSPRRFPPPWSIEELEACFVVNDSAGQKLGYFYYEEEPGRAIGGLRKRARPRIFRN
jgi:hypothetical protein